MKLKKIASLALAGIMAVSMLAGCSGKGNTNPDNGETVTTTDIVAAVNDGQSADNDVTIKFTSNSHVATVLDRVIEMYGKSTTEKNIEDALKNLEDIKSVGHKNVHTTDFYSAVDTTTGFLTGGMDYSLKGNKADIDGDVYTYVSVKKYTGFASEAALLNYIADTADDLIADLAAHSKTDAAKGGDKYCAYDYNGTVNMASVKQVDGTTAYYVVAVVEQTITEKTL